jgi:pyruvate dehydrogenase E2 component (dihydrolipoamide acetyltransferase)
MAEVIIMPKLGFNMSEGQLVKWCKVEGDKIKSGEVFFEINTDKTNMSIDAVNDGIILKLLIKEGDFVDVFTPIAVVGEVGEDVDVALAVYAKQNNNGDETVTTKENQVVPAIISESEKEINLSDIKLTPRARKYIKENDIDLASVVNIDGTGYQGGITEKDINVSPLAKKMAEKCNIDLVSVNGTGIHGKIMKQDIKKIAEKIEEKSVEVNAEWKVLSKVPYKGIRKVIGDRLSQSKFTAPHLYFTDEVDTTNMTSFRKMINETSNENISVSALFILACSKALQKYPGVNSCIKNDELITYVSTNIGIAVAGDKGLLVPVVKNAQEKNLIQISKEAKDLVNRAKEGHLSPDEMGGTFTITNLGMFGIDNFTAIINPPEAAILSVSSVKKKAIVITENGDDTIIIRPMMNIQLSVDHRIIDGLLAAQFVGYIKELLENPIHIVI